MSALVTNTRGFDMLTEDTANALEKKYMRVLGKVVTMSATQGRGEDQQRLGLYREGVLGR